MAKRWNQNDNGVFLKADEESDISTAKKQKKNLEEVESKEEDLKERLEIEPEVNPEEKPNLGLKPKEQSIIKRKYKPENITMEGSNGTKTQKKVESELKGNLNKEDTKKDTQEDTEEDKKEYTQVSKMKQDKNMEIEVGVKLEENPIKEREHKAENGAIDEIKENKKDKEHELESKEILNKEDTKIDTQEDMEKDTKEDTQVPKKKQDKNTEIEVGVKLEENPIKEREHEPENRAIDEIEVNKKDKEDELESKKNLNKEYTKKDTQEDTEKDRKEDTQVPKMKQDKNTEIEVGMKLEENPIKEREHEPENRAIDAIEVNKKDKEDELESKKNLNKEDTKKDTEKDTKEDTQVPKMKQDKNTEIEVGVKLEENPIKEREHEPENRAIDEIEVNKKEKEDELESKENLNKEDTKEDTDDDMDDDMEEDYIENDTEDEDMEELTGTTMQATIINLIEKLENER